ncbi:MAG: PilN domain-containing protein [Gammaproteobacteria bacterium]|nr:PilN domain-containing protein [Gammaproteobacteria bacterium]
MSNTRLNLLPWREELRRQKTTEFSILAGVVIVATLIVAAGAWFQIGLMIDHQKTRNQYLESQINVLQTKLDKIKELETVKNNLLARMNIIQELQRSRPEVVHLFEEIVKTIPDGLWVSKINQQNKKLSIEGLAESNARVSAYMRNLEASTWLKNPVLDVITADKETKVAQFTLSAEQESPNAEK